MKTNEIPGWNSYGILPPIHALNPTSADRSPYHVSLTDVVLRFCTTTERCRILSGFLEFRKSLHSIGIENGFQWIDGSFLEHIEILEGRDPADVDVVTFFHLPPGKTEQDLLTALPGVFDPTHTKADYHVDAYFVRLDTGIPEPLVAQSTYWYSFWSHRRDGRWKGYLQIDLSPTDDEVAVANLDRLVEEGGRQ